jgi:hypothetical protein
MKKTFLTTLSLCVFALSANAAETKTADAIDAKETARRAQIEKVQTCKNVLDACQKSGFVAGGFSEGNGLWRNCFYPVIEGKTATQKGKEVKVAFNAKDVAACKPSVTK